MTRNGGRQAFPGVPENLVSAPNDQALTPNPDGKLSPIEKLQRDSELVQLMRRGVSSEVAGPAFGLSPRQARRIYKTYRPRYLEDLESFDPKAVIEEMIGQFDSAISDLALLSRDASSDSVRMGATRTRLEAVKGKIELLQSLGIMTLDLGTITLKDDVVRLIRIILFVLDAYEVDDEVQMAIVDAVEGRTPQLPEGKRIIDVEEGSNGSGQ